MLQTAPSFDIYSNNTNDGVEAKDEKKNKIDEEISDFSFDKQIMGLIKEEDVVNETEEINNEILDNEQIDPINHSMYLATGLGISKDNGSHDFGDMDEISEESCRELLEQYPNHPIVLRKYAELLQGCGNLQAAEEYYFQAAQADPLNGELMIQYAQLVWELHHDRERALTYFELAAQSAPQNSNVLAAIAKFLWEAEDDVDDKSVHPDSVQEDHLQKPVHVHHVDVSDVKSEAVAEGVTDQISDVGSPSESEDIESYYKRMIEQNPSNPLYLKKYAQQLYQSKGDLQGAEEYYSRAILADPKDGEILSEFATLLWELYHNQDRTLSYLERAIEAAPQNSDVLAAYARILWAIDDE